MATAAPQTQPYQHLLQLKVMRLSRPQFVTFSMRHPQSSDTRSATVVPAVPSELLAFPSAFGNIYLGETFGCFLALNNEFPVFVSDVVVKAELQTNSSKVSLIDDPAANPSFGPDAEIHHGRVRLRKSSLLPTSGATESSTTDQNLDLAPGETAECALSHEIKELGTHILMCTVQYTVDQERRFFRKLFKFQVLNPVSMRTKISTLPDASVILEAQVQNNCNADMWIENMAFDPVDVFEANEASYGILNSGKNILLAQQEARQFLYVLRPRVFGDLAAATCAQLGRLDISWRTAVGGKGRLQTSQLLRKGSTNVESFEVMAVDLDPGRDTLAGSLITCRIAIKNNSVSDPLTVSISLPRTKSAGLVPIGAASLSHGPIAPGQSSVATLSFRAAAVGLHRIGNIIVSDTSNGVSRQLDSLAEVFVRT